jgi:hypothetical protein
MASASTSTPPRPRRPALLLADHGLRVVERFAAAGVPTCRSLPVCPHLNNRTPLAARSMAWIALARTTS